MYSEKLMKLFRKPHNFGKIKNADAVGKVGNVICGDVMYLYLKIKDNRIKDVKFETFGCAAAIGTSSIITDMIKGKTIEEALKVSKDDIAKEIGGLPPIKMHCSVLATEALKKAVEDYRMRQKTKSSRKAT
ncbi:iron-sulfur cluster assembly scaffold protein [Candidatus Micrarchaeota archaeon]|nr:iron-sulfur cluster assembly scaffold protein [Candidatus Micrarchaeota archaeon]